MNRVSRDRWRCEARLAGVKCTFPSSASGDGVTVAALAVHIADADDAADTKPGSVRNADASTSASLPTNPNLLSVGMCGRSGGSRLPWMRPRSMR